MCSRTATTALIMRRARALRPIPPGVPRMAAGGAQTCGECDASGTLARSARVRVHAALMSSQLLATLLLVPVLAAQALPRRPAQPNVLFLVSDDLRPQLDIPGYGADGAPITTPRLAALAAESFVFTRAYCQEALCAPSRNSFREPVSVAARDFLATSTATT